MGRTGKLFAYEWSGVTPDIVTMAKGIASGLPLGVTTARADVMAWPPGAHASTFGGNPVSCAAALKTIELIKGSMMQNAAEVGAFMLDQLKGGFMSAGADAVTAGERAVAAMHGILAQQATMVTFVSIFRLLGGIFLLLIPLIALMKRPKGRPSAAAAH